MDQRLLQDNSVSRVVLRLFLVAVCTLAGGIWLHLQGPISVVRITTPLPEAAPFWYMLLAFPVLGLLLADLLDLYRLRGASAPTLELALQIGLIVVLSSARLGARIPLSGHSLLASYFILRRLLLRSRPRSQSPLEVWLACGALAAIAYPKLAWWRDPVTLFTGIAVGALLAGFSRWFEDVKFQNGEGDLDPM
jgi:hypothetical protein